MEHAATEDMPSPLLQAEMPYLRLCLLDHALPKNKGCMLFGVTFAFSHLEV